MLRDKSTKDFESWDMSRYVRLARENPIRALVRSEGEFFSNDNNDLMGLNEGMREVIGNEEFCRHMRDAVVYRCERYYEERSFSMI